MSDEPQTMICRRCGEVIRVDIDNCPHCGKSTQGRGPYIAIVLGAIMVLSSLLKIRQLWLFALIGLALIGIGAWMIRDKRQRIADAGALPEEEEA